MICCDRHTICARALEDKTKIVGINDSRLFIIPFENQLYGIDFSLLTNFSFNPSLEQREISNPLDEIYRSMGIPQYMEEIKKKKILEKMLSKDMPTDPRE